MIWANLFLYIVNMVLASVFIGGAICDFRDGRYFRFGFDVMFALLTILNCLSIRLGLI